MDCGAAYFCRTDCTLWWTCRNMTPWSHWGLVLWDFLSKTMIIFFQSCLKWPEEWPIHSPTSYQTRTELLSDQRVLCVYHDFKEHLTFGSVCFSFYFQRCPVWLQWPWCYQLALTQLIKWTSVIHFPSVKKCLCITSIQNVRPSTSQASVQGLVPFFPPALCTHHSCHHTTHTLFFKSS